MAYKTDRRPVETVDMLSDQFPGHVDIPRMRAGKLGGVFMSVWIPCEENVEFMNPDTVGHTISRKGCWLVSDVAGRYCEMLWSRLT